MRVSALTETPLSPWFAHDGPLWSAFKVTVSAEYIRRYWLRIPCAESIVRVPTLPARAQFMVTTLSCR
jgi:hypothetical protein